MVEWLRRLKWNRVWIMAVREKLGIKGAWPYYLNKPSPEASAIAEPARVWQAALFARFVLGKADSDSRIVLETRVEWVIGRFGLVENRSADAAAAVRKYLAYLSACGFLEKSPYNPYGTPYYEVAHGDLQPPPSGIFHGRVLFVRSIHWTYHQIFA
jgi:hypothetical protein